MAAKCQLQTPLRSYLTWCVTRPSYRLYIWGLRTTNHNAFRELLWKSHFASLMVPLGVSRVLYHHPVPLCVDNIYPLEYAPWSHEFACHIDLLTVWLQTLVSLSHYVYNTDSSIFPDPETFRPERWLGDDLHLDRHLVSFSRGSRGCIGIK